MKELDDLTGNEIESDNQRRKEEIELDLAIADWENKNKQ